MLITKAIVALHNYLMVHKSNYCPLGHADSDTTNRMRPGGWRNEIEGFTGMTPIGTQGSNNFSRPGS